MKSNQQIVKSTQTRQQELITCDPSLVEKLEYQLEECRNTISYLQARVDQLEQDKYVIPISEIQSEMNDTPMTEKNHDEIQVKTDLDRILHYGILGNFSNPTNDLLNQMESLEKLTTILRTHNLEHAQMAGYNQLAYLTKT